MACFQIPGDLALNADETDLILVQNPESILQQIRVGAQIFQGTWTYDRNAGLPYRDVILERNTPLNVIRAVYWDFLSSIHGVVEIQRLDLTKDTETGTLNVEFSVLCDSGEVLTDSIGFAIQ